MSDYELEKRRGGFYSSLFGNCVVRPGALVSWVLTGSHNTEVREMGPELFFVSPRKAPMEWWMWGGYERWGRIDSWDWRFQKSTLLMF